MPWDFWLIFAVLAVVLPWRGRSRLRKMLAAAHMTPRERIGLYVSTIAFQWCAAGLTFWRASARSLRWNDLGLFARPPLRIALAAIVGAVTLSALQWLNLRRMAKSSGKVREFMQALAERILPQSSAELIPYVGLALTAGICEEFLYRGFAIAAFSKAGLTMAATVLISSFLFGLAHLYQGRGGFVGTLLIGVVFAIGRITYHSLIPVMAWHFAVDMAAGVAGPKYLVRSQPADAPVLTSSGT